METAKTVSKTFRHRQLPSALSLGGLSVATLTRRVWSSLIQDEIVDRSAELAYYFLFAMFPALILLSAMFSLFATTSARANLELMLYLAKVIPPAAFASVETAFSQTTRESSTGHIVFGGIAAVWAATYGMSSAQTVLNVIYRAKESRPYWKAKAIAMICTMAIFVLVCSAMLLLILGDDLAKFLSSDLMFNPLLLAPMESCEICGGHVFHVACLFHHLPLGSSRQRTPLALDLPGGDRRHRRMAGSFAGLQNLSALLRSLCQYIRIVRCCHCFVDLVLCQRIYVAAGCRD